MPDSLPAQILSAFAVYRLRKGTIVKLNLIQIVCVILSVLSLSACAVVSGNVSSPLTTSPPPPVDSPRIATSVINAGECIDPTTSTVSEFSASMKSMTASAIATWVPTVRVTTTGLPVVRGLTFTLRQVLTDSFTSAAPRVTVDIPPVYGLKPRLDATDPNFSSDDPIWISGRNAAEADLARAEASAAAGASQIRAYQFVSQTSEIAGCLSALAETVPGPRRALILASDLEQNEAPQIAGNLHNTAILVIQPCSGDAATCGALAASWRAAMARRGASQIAFIRPEDVSPAAITNFLKGEPRP